jgi:hypothetical protein
MAILEAGQSFQLMLDILQLTEFTAPESGRELPGDMGRISVRIGIDRDPLVAVFESWIVAGCEPELSVGRHEGSNRLLARVSLRPVAILIGPPPTLLVSRGPGNAVMRTSSGLVMT